VVAIGAAEDGRGGRVAQGGEGGAAGNGGRVVHGDDGKMSGRR
jgi:hypothetical protein